MALSLAALLMAASLGLATLLASYARSAIVELASDNAQALSAQMSRELSFGLDRFAREIQLQADNPAFADPASSPASMRARLEGIQKTYPEFAHISVVDIASAKVIAATGGIFEGGDAKGRPVFEEGKKALFIADVHDAVRLAALLPAPSSGEPLRFLDVAAPILAADGQPFRVLGAHLSWQWTAAMKERVLAPVEAGRKVQLMLVDGQGRVALPPDPSVPVGTAFAELLGPALRESDKPWADGRAYLRAEAPTFAAGASKGLGWRVVVRQPMSIVLASSERLRAMFLGGGLLLGLASAAVGWLLAGRLLRPVSDLARAASALAPGSNLAAESKPGYEPEEIAQVREAFQRVTGDALRRAETLLDELNSIYQGAPVGLCVVGADMRYARVNEVWADAFGLGPNRGVGAIVSEAGTPPALVEALREALRADIPWAVEVETGPASAPRHWHAVLAPVRERAGQAAGVSAVATDITEIRKAERELRQADERKNQFVSMLAHELRNPLAPISNALGVLAGKPTQAQADRVRTMMENQVRRMVRLIDDLLDVSRVNLGKVAMRIEQVTVREICEGAIESSRHLIDAKGQRLEVAIDDSLPPLRGDKVRLEQVVCNLLSNASKYGREGGFIGLTASSDGRRVLFVVEDDGRGISAEFLPHVFELFSQGDVALARTEGGLGIGLSLVKNLVEQHGGEVTAESLGNGLGSRFTVALPVSAAELASPAKPAVQADEKASGC